ncbi:Hypothetical protein MVR_LOCUS302 [uncultured virus]|nr:Hypothetical protein MVR_LOCUS302 [uncultured virus]
MQATTSIQAVNVCLSIESDLVQAINDTNYELLQNITASNTYYSNVCVNDKTNYNYYASQLGIKWNSLFNRLMNESDCTLHKIPGSIANAAQVKSQLKQATQAVSSSQSLDNVFASLASAYTKTRSSTTYPVFNINVFACIINTLKITLKYCSCYLKVFFTRLVVAYRDKYISTLNGLDTAQVQARLKSDYNQLLDAIYQVTNVAPNSVVPLIMTRLNQNSKHQLALPQASSQPTLLNNSLLELTIINELDKLIPDKLGAMKQFFIKVISKYYANTHPIIWAQIIKYAVSNYAIEKPYTPTEIFAFLSKCILLNSGPFILKILQTVRPVLTLEQQQKYNLTKLSYPLLTKPEYMYILTKYMIGLPNYTVIANVSASVGHVCIMEHNTTKSKIVVKMIKPVSIIQSCWEYNTLKDIYPVGSCERDFLLSMAESNGQEIKVANEIANLKMGHKLYTATYRKIFHLKSSDSSNDASITTIQNIDGIIRPECWFGLAMTYAPGFPLSQVQEGDIKLSDADYLKLYRCLDLLVDRFFYNLIVHGFYHGDLHAGNIFFDPSVVTMTLIDFGAVGHIDLLGDDGDASSPKSNSSTSNLGSDNSSSIPSSNDQLIRIIIMSSFYNYDGMLDAMTDLLNSKCVNSKSDLIDKTSSKYTAFKSKLVEYKIANLTNKQREQQRTQEYKSNVFNQAAYQSDLNELDSIYTPLNIYFNQNYKTEAIANTESITFNGVLEQIMEFYAESNVNIPMKFNELYTLQKSYVLLMGVLSKLGYDSIRSSIVISKTMSNIGLVTKTTLKNPKKVWEVLGYYRQQHKLNKAFVKSNAITSNLVDVPLNRVNPQLLEFIKLIK